MRELIADMSSGLMVNLTSANGHVPKIEGGIQLVKERCRATRHNIPFTRLPVILNINIVLKMLSSWDTSPHQMGF